MSVGLFSTPTQGEVATKVGITSAGLSKIESGDRNPSEQLIRSVCREFRINYPWLKEGVGEMQPQPDTDDEMVDRIMAGAPSFAKDVMRAFARLGDDEWAMLERFVQSIKKEER